MPKVKDLFTARIIFKDKKENISTFDNIASKRGFTRSQAIRIAIQDFIHKFS